MHTDDVASPDQTPPTDGSDQDAASSDSALPRAMSASELEPDPADEPTRLTRREARERRRRDESAAKEAAGAGVSATAPDAPTDRPGTAEGMSTAPGLVDVAVGAGGDADGSGTDVFADAPEADQVIVAAAPSGGTVTVDAETDSTVTEVTAADGTGEDLRSGEAGVEPTALSWVDPASLTTERPGTASSGQESSEPLVPPRRRRRPAVVASVVAVAGVIAAYAVACTVWPLDEVAPTVAEAKLSPAVGQELSVPWPEVGGAAVAAVGQETIAASNETTVPMASITKLVSVLMVLERQPLEVGEQGPSYTFTWDDQNAFWGYAARGESRLEVPVDGSLTQYQLLQGILLGSANNWANRLVEETFGSIEAFAEEVPAWLERNGLSNMTVVEPSGIDYGNAATPADVARLGELALQNPVVADIVAQKQADLPGPGLVENSNPLLADAGVVGIKTGTLLDSSNLVVARDVTVGDDDVTVVASIMGQPDNDTRDEVARSLLEAAAASLEPMVAVPTGTTVAKVSTEWGESAELVTTEDATLVLWNGATSTTAAELGGTLGLTAGDRAGTLTVTGSFSEDTVALELTDELGEPSFWWRLTHPFDLIGWQ